MSAQMGTRRGQSGADVNLQAVTLSKGLRNLVLPAPPSYAVDSPYLVPFDGSFNLSNYSCEPPEEAPGKKKCNKIRRANVETLAELQEILFAEGARSVLVKCQAFDAAGKGGLIDALTEGVTAAGFQCFYFKAPSEKELKHDFLWRTGICNPEKGRIGMWDRSEFEETIVVKVHPEFLKGQKIELPDKPEVFWQQRWESMVNEETHLARNGTVIIKFFLHVSQLEQLKRFLARGVDPTKDFKFSKQDFEEAKLRPKYLKAVQETLQATSTPWAPWYVLPADDKPFMRMTASDIIVRTMQGMDLKYPELSTAKKEENKRVIRQIKRKIAQLEKNKG